MRIHILALFALMTLAGCFGTVGAATARYQNLASGNSGMGGGINVPAPTMGAPQRCEPDIIYTNIIIIDQQDQHIRDQAGRIRELEDELADTQTEHGLIILLAVWLAELLAAIRLADHQTRNINKKTLD